jgi:DNA-binding transcriptional MerR regulator
MSDSEEAALRNKLYAMVDLVSEFGITDRAIRFYEDRGLLSPGRVAGRRVYSPEQRARLIEILKGKALGLTLAEIADALRTGAGNVQLSVEEIDDQIAHLERQKKGMDTAIAALMAQRLQRHRAEALDRNPSDRMSIELTGNGGAT